MPEFKFTMGADPEFNLTLFNKRLDAKATIKKAMDSKFPKEETVLGRGESMGYNIRDKGSVGWDGCNSTGELRPMFSANPHKVAENVGELIKELNNSLPIMDIITTNALAPVGGHIHFTIPDGISVTHQSLNNMMKNLQSSYKLFML